MITKLSQQEKNKLYQRFDLSSLNETEKERFQRMLFGYLDKFPVLNEIARDVIKKGLFSIKFEINRLKNCAGEQSGHSIRIDTDFWKKYSNSLNEKEIVSVFWHELLHYTQEQKLSDGFSKRAHIVYRQFIEAEAQSISNLIASNSDFEKKLLKTAQEKFSDITEAQKYYLGVATRLRLYADRELAKQEAKNLMGKNFDENEWKRSEKYFIQDWRDYYYKYHAEHINVSSYKGLYAKKFITDKKIMKRIEDYFFEKYGIHVSPKSSVSKEVIDTYGMTIGIQNTIWVDNQKDDIFDISKWKQLDGADKKQYYILDLPDMDPNYIDSLQMKLKENGVHSEQHFVSHRDGRMSRCLSISNDGSESAIKFLFLCGKQKDPVPNLTEPTIRPPVPPKPLKQVNLKKGMNVAVDIYNPPILKMGANKETTFDLKDILNQKRIDFLKGGGIMLLGGNPLSPYAKIPSEVRNYQGVVKSYQIGETDGTVSNAQGYLYMARDGKFYYKDCSSYGTHLFMRPEKTFNKQMSYSR